MDSRNRHPLAALRCRDRQRFDLSLAECRRHTARADLRNHGSALDEFATRTAARDVYYPQVRDGRSGSAIVELDSDCTDPDDDGHALDSFEPTDRRQSKRR